MNDDRRWRWIDQAMLAGLAASAAAAPRRRKNLNFHAGDDFPAHRLLNAIEPDSYIPPHCHLDPAKDETIVVVRGRIGVILFAADGRILEAAVLAAGGERAGIDIPHGVFHTLVALEPGSVMFEAKAGPFVPLSAAERAAWAPAEGEAGVADYQQLLRRCFL